LDAIQTRAGKPRLYRLYDLKMYLTDPKTAIPFGMGKLMCS
jgi:hypothetical protein